MDQGVGHVVKKLREERNWSQARLAVEADMSVSGVSMIENGQRNLTTTTLAKLARAFGVEIGDLFPKGQNSLWHEEGTSLEDGPSLEELHFAAMCVSRWLIVPEEKWAAAWPLDLHPAEAMIRVREMDDELFALMPLIAEQERGLPITKRQVNGRYRQAWLRYLTGVGAAHRCGVANGLITPEENLNDLAERLGAQPVTPIERSVGAASPKDA